MNPAVQAVAREHGDGAVPVVEPVEDPAVDPGQHVGEQGATVLDLATRHSEQRHEGPVDLGVGVDREGERERRDEARVALDDVRVVEHGHVAVRQGGRPEPRGDRARLEDLEPLLVERPLDVLRAALLRLEPLDEGHDALDLGRGQHLRDPSVHDASQDPVVAQVVPVALASHQGVGEAAHRRHHGDVAAARHRVGREGDPRRPRPHHGLHDHRGRPARLPAQRPVGGHALGVAGRAHLRHGVPEVRGGHVEQRQELTRVGRLRSVLGRGGRAHGVRPGSQQAGEGASREGHVGTLEPGPVQDDEGRHGVATPPQGLEARRLAPDHRGVVPPRRERGHGIMSQAHVGPPRNGSSPAHT